VSASRDGADGLAAHTGFLTASEFMDPS
jgi:hypothetical protein